MRRLMGALLLAALCAGVSPASAATAPFPYDLSLRGPYGTTEVTVPIPVDTSPVRFTGRIESSFSSPGRFLIAINGVIRDRVATSGGRFRIPLNRSDVVDGGVTIGIEVRLRPTEDCLRDDPSTAIVRNPRLVLNRQPGRADTIAEFLSPATRSFIVAVPQQPTTDEQAAGLNAVLAVRHLLGRTPTITVQATDDPPASSPNRRVIVVTEDGSGSSALTVRAGRLHVTGSAGEVQKAAVSIADPNSALLDVRSVTNLSGTADYAPAPTTTTISDLGIAALSVRGIGTVSTTAEVPQAAFGQPVSQIILTLRGAVTPVRKGQQGRINVRWNDELVTSQALTDSPRVALDFTVGAGSLFAVNYLTVEMEYLPGGAYCQQPLPGELQIDTAGSSVVAQVGDSAPPGFQRFPQSFPATIPVSFGTADGPSVENAARLLDAAASVSPLQYTVTIADEPTRAPGALVAGVTPSQSQALGAPLPDQQNLANFPPGRSTAYAALQAYYSHGDDLIVLSEQPRRAAKELARFPETQDGGWSGLTGQVYVMAATMETPQEFVVPSTAPDRQRPQLIAAGVLTIALLGGLLVWLRWRFKRR